MTEPTRNVLIIGTGVVGQVFGGSLQRAGHHVTFVTRGKHLLRLQEHGLDLRPRGREPSTVRTARFITEPDDLAQYDWVLACVRGEQREDLARRLDPHDPAGARVILCFPAWHRTLTWFRDHVRRSFYLFPGLSGVFRNEAVEYRIGTTRIGPLFSGSIEECAELANLFAAAGLRSVVQRRLVEQCQVLWAAGFPILLALAAHGYCYDEAMRDTETIRLAMAAQHETLGMLRALDEPLGLLGGLLQSVPPTLGAPLVQASRLIMTGFNRDMLEIHFRKVDAQSRVMLRELIDMTRHTHTPHQHVEALLDRAT